MLRIYKHPLTKPISVLVILGLILTLLPGCGGGGAPKGEEISTKRVSGSVKKDEIGGTGLVVQSA